MACAWFSGLSGLLGSCFWSFLPRSSSGCGCFSWPPVLFILRLPGFLGDCGFADVDGDSLLGVWVDVRLWAFFLLGFHLAACFPYGWLVRRLGSLPPIFPLTFSFGVVVAPWFLVGVLQRFFPPGGFLLQFVEVGLPPLWRWRAWMAEAGRPVRSSGRLPSACSCLSSSPLALHGVVSTSPVCLSRAPAFRQVCVAMLAEGSVESPSVLVLAFHSSLFLVEGSSDGSAPGDRPSPLDGCVSRSVSG